MNLTFPIMDWLMGTSDLDRGLFGHLFNGYSTEHIRQDLRHTRRIVTSFKSIYGDFYVSNTHQCLIDIPEYVVNMLKPHRDAHHIRGYSGCLLLFFI